LCLDETLAAILRSPTSCVLFTAGWSVKSQALLGSLHKSSSDITLVTVGAAAEDTGIRLLHIELDASDDAMEAAVALGVPSTLPAIVRYHATDGKCAAFATENVDAFNILAVLAAPLSSAATFLLDFPVPAISDAPSAGAAQARSSTVQSVVKAGTCVRIFVAGDKTHCGKTTICLGILGTLLRAGVPPNRFMFIKFDLLFSASMTATVSCSGAQAGVHQARDPMRGGGFARPVVCIHGCSVRGGCKRPAGLFQGLYPRISRWSCGHLARMALQDCRGG